MHPRECNYNSHKMSHIEAKTPSTTIDCIFWNYLSTILFKMTVSAIFIGVTWSRFTCFPICLLPFRNSSAGSRHGTFYQPNQWKYLWSRGGLHRQALSLKMTSGWDKSFASFLLHIIDMCSYLRTTKFGYFISLIFLEICTLYPTSYSCFIPWEPALHVEISPD